MTLSDKHGREINYMRLAVTDRCNLKCFYCMPENGIQYVNRRDLLSYEEMLRIISVFGDHGISKLRITGGEPFVRKGIMEFLEEISRIEKVKQIHVTTNGTFTEDKIEQLQRIGIRSINLSLDSTDSERFYQITRKNLFDTVWSTLHSLIKSEIDVKVNMVVMEGKNIEDIYPMLELARENVVNVRFIEEMPFNGTLGQGNASFWSIQKILEHIKKEYQIEKLQDQPSSTSYNYKIPGFKGDFGIIAAYTRSFCGTCNRIRLTPQGDLRTCLYGEGVINFRNLMRSGKSDKELIQALQVALDNKAKDGFEAERRRLGSNPVSESMATIGG